VILFDEIEKAHPDVFNALLQVLDDGRLTDGQGRTVDFKNTVVILTSKHRLRGDRALEERRDLTDDERARLLSATALSALRLSSDRNSSTGWTRSSVFRRLGPDQLRAIVDLQLDRLAQRLSDRGDPSHRHRRSQGPAGEVGFDPQFGARPLKGTIQRPAREPARGASAGRRLSARLHAGGRSRG
jgi:ATP-dependent Clp protease ATP-binding subunit ClpB